MPGTGTGGPYDLWAIGACGCGCTGCSPCTLPASNLHMDYTIFGKSGTNALLTYTAPCSWASACIVPTGAASSFTVSVVCSGGITTVTLTTWNTSLACSGANTVYTWKSNGTGSGLQLVSTNCVALAVKWSRLPPNDTIYNFEVKL